MTSAKKAALETIQDLPDDVSMEDIHYYLFVREKMESGHSEAKDDHTIGTPDVNKRMKLWLEK